MFAEQRLEAEAQGGIIGTSLVQIGSTLAGGQLQGRAKEGHFAIGRGAHGLPGDPLYNQYNQTAN